MLGNIFYQPHIFQQASKNQAVKNGYLHSVLLKLL